MGKSIFRFGPFEAKTDAQELSKNGTGQMAFLKVTRRLDPVRSGPRFADLLHRMGLDVGHAST